MNQHPNSSSPVLLLMTRPRRVQVRIAFFVVALLVLILVLALPFADLDTRNTAFTLPAYAVAVLVVEVITAAMLLAQFAVQPARPLLLVISAYLFSGLMVVPWMLSFPDFADLLGLDAGLQGMAFLAALRRLVFPLLLLAYVCTKERDTKPGRSAPVWFWIGATVLGTVIAAVLSAWIAFAHNGDLPHFMVSETEVGDLWRHVPQAALATYGILLALLLSRKRSVLDLWLIVVTCTLAMEVVLLFYATGGTRFSLGWWAGRFCGLISSSTVLVALLAETTTLYARLARSVAEERRVRESRLTAMEALSASIAHEINQPLTSISTNAAAGLRWLDRDAPDINETRDALIRIGGDSQRASDVVNGIRIMFKKGAREYVTFDLQKVILEAVAKTENNIRQAEITLEFHISEEARPAEGNPIQISQVVCNLIANAVDAITAADDSMRIIRITVENRPQGITIVSISDTGIGIKPEAKERLFEPFYTTKPDGMGMGLMFSQSIIETHGGQIRFDSNKPRGTVVSFTLPKSSHRENIYG